MNSKLYLNIKYLIITLFALSFFGSCSKEEKGAIDDISNKLIFFKPDQGSPLCFEIFVGNGSLSSCQWISEHHYEHELDKNNLQISSRFSSATYEYYFIDESNAVLNSTNYQQTSSATRCWIGKIQMSFNSHNSGTFTMYEQALPYLTVTGTSHTLSGTFVIKNK